MTTVAEREITNWTLAQARLFELPKMAALLGNIIETSYSCEGNGGMPDDAMNSLQTSLRAIINTIVIKEAETPGDRQAKLDAIASLAKYDDADIWTGDIIRIASSLRERALV